MGNKDIRKKQKISMLLTLKNIEEIKDYLGRGTFPIFKTRFQKRDFKKKAKMFVATSKGMLIREDNGVCLVAVGNDDIERINNVCRYAHDYFGHCKAAASWKKIRMHWMGFRKNHLLNWISKCSVCVLESQQAMRKTKVENKKNGEKEVTAYFSMERLQMDCISMAEYAVHNEGFSYILHIVDVYSRYHFACPLQQKDSAEICRCLSALFEKEGWPHILQSDFDKAFVSDEISSLLAANRVLHIYPSRGTAQSLKIVRKSREVLKKKLLKVMKTKSHGYSWVSALKDTVIQWNSEFSASIMSKPNLLFRTAPPDIDQYMQPPAENAVPNSA
ncbi:hypothetical protein NEMIN01_0943 [Nematocida minor]|uniref:uncharacterized protein n=1 Tax=Nematocida minor TaxID=1912983 RepID=UPI00221F6DC0|nr:uncharacterized protein NEMIN01_0943 [Nematocida minor]KAI5190244.1 hypothetical protein NEMIN01_0943 [Nematocida minor]